MIALKRGNANAAAAIAATLVLGAGAVIAGVAASATRQGAGAEAPAAKPDDRVAAGVRIAQTVVGGMTREEAAEQARQWARKALTRPVTLVGPRSGRRWNFTLYDIGGRFAIDEAVDGAYAVGRDGSWVSQVLARVQASRNDVEIRPAFHLDEKRLKQRLGEVGEAVRVPARNVRAKMTDGILIVTAPERKGVRLDVDATAAALLKDGAEALRNGVKTRLVIAEEEPAVTGDDLGAVSHLLGSFSTHYGSSSRDRRHNVELAASHINGTLIEPGGTFSYNDVVGPRVRRLGWREAPTYQDGQVVPGTGGGICQVSSTLYNAVLLSNLKIVRRSHHSMPVQYVRAGRDATVAYGAIDFQFGNDTDGPVYVSARASGGRLTLALYGKEPKEKPEIKIVSGPRHSRSAGGFVVSTYRVAKSPDGATTRELLSTDTYRPLVKASAARPRP